MLLLTNTDFKKPNTVQEEIKKEKKRKGERKKTSEISENDGDRDSDWLCYFGFSGWSRRLHCQRTKRICVQRKKKRKEGKELGPRPRRYGGVSRGPHGKPSETSVGDIAPAGCRRQ